MVPPRVTAALAVPDYRTYDRASEAHILNQSTVPPTSLFPMLTVGFSVEQ